MNKEDLLDKELSGPTKCKICGETNFKTVREVSEYMLTHAEYVNALDKLLPGFKDIKNGT